MKKTTDRYVVVGTYLIRGESRSAVDEYPSREAAMGRFGQLVADELYTPHSANSLKVQTLAEYRAGAR